jgi:hypothetical protein
VGYTGTKATGNNNTIVIDAAHAGDNFIVVVDTTQNNVNNLATLGATETERYTESHGYYQSELLTVWRTLWMELDVMATPTATITDGFDPANQGTTWSLPGNIPTTEPANFDILAQPTKPDITLLQTAMLAACIEVKEVSQDSGNLSWLVGDTSNADPNDDYIDGTSASVGQWDETRPFIHNLTSDQDNALDAVSANSRDVTVNNAQFWCIHLVSAYESIVAEDGDGEYTRTYGIVSTSQPVVILFDETIRDLANSPAKNDYKPLNTLKQINVMHEVLHLLGLRHADGGVMATGSSNTLPGTIDFEPHNFRITNTRAESLLEEQIKKIQAKLYPSW